jgi:hypothetical protein
MRHGYAGAVTDKLFHRHSTGSHRLVIRDTNGRLADVSKSVLEAIREGNWFFEPPEVESNRFDATMAVPGSREKLDVLAARAREGLPLWHTHDRADYDDPYDA